MPALWCQYTQKQDQYGDAETSKSTFELIVGSPMDERPGFALPAFFL
jgi:hypothetical protein